MDGSALCRRHLTAEILEVIAFHWPIYEDGQLREGLPYDLTRRDFNKVVAQLSKPVPEFLRADDPSLASWKAKHREEYLEHMASRRHSHYCARMDIGAAGYMHADGTVDGAALWADLIAAGFGEHAPRTAEGPVIAGGWRGYFAQACGRIQFDENGICLMAPFLTEEEKYEATRSPRKTGRTLHVLGQFVLGIASVCAVSGGVWLVAESAPPAIRVAADLVEEGPAASWPRTVDGVSAEKRQLGSDGIDTLAGGALVVLGGLGMALARRRRVSSTYDPT